MVLFLPRFVWLISRLPFVPFQHHVSNRNACLRIDPCRVSSHPIPSHSILSPTVLSYATPSHSIPFHFVPSHLISSHLIQHPNPFAPNSQHGPAQPNLANLIVSHATNSRGQHSPEAPPANSSCTVAPKRAHGSFFLNLITPQYWTANIKGVTRLSSESNLTSTFARAVTSSRMTL